MIRFIVPESFAGAFLAFFESKCRENPPKVKTVSALKDDSYLIHVRTLALTKFDDLIKRGISIKSAISETNYALKASGIANITYDMTKQILSKSGRLRVKSS